MKILVTAGSTDVMIDQVRSISNIFKGRTGTEIACYMAGQGHTVTLLTSNKSLLTKYIPTLTVIEYKTYDDLRDLMECQITHLGYDVIIHSAAVSDYAPDGIFYVRDTKYINGERYVLLRELDSSGKVSSDHVELYPKLIPTEKIIDKIRRDWGFTGKLVKFKLQVNISNIALIDIAKESLKTSQADLIVANCLEWSKERAFICHSNGRVQDVTRPYLAFELHKSLCGE